MASPPPGVEHSVDSLGWLDAPPEAWAGRIFGGMIVPSALAALGVCFIATQHAVLPGRSWQRLTDGPAIALGLSAIGAAIFFHAHAFWGPVWRLAIIHQLGCILGAVLFVLSFGYVLFSLLWMGKGAQPPAKRRRFASLHLSHTRRHRLHFASNQSFPTPASTRSGQRKSIAPSISSTTTLLIASD